MQSVEPATFLVRVLITGSPHRSHVTLSCISATAGRSIVSSSILNNASAGAVSMISFLAWRSPAARPGGQSHRRPSDRSHKTPSFHLPRRPHRRFVRPTARHDSGQVPVGQLELPADEFPDRAAKLESIFSVPAEPHSSQRCLRRLPPRSRTAVTWPHFRQRYSKMGTAILLRPLPARSFNILRSRHEFAAFRALHL